MDNINDLSSFRALYVKTAKEQIEIMHNALLALAKNVADMQAIDNAHRAAHSLKSESFAMEQMTTSQLAHLLENIFAKAKDGSLILSLTLIESIEDAIKKIQVSLDASEKEGKELPLNEEVSRLIVASGISEA